MQLDNLKVKVGRELSLDISTEDFDAPIKEYTDTTGKGKGGGNNG